MIIAYLSVSGFYIINANQYNILKPSKILFNKKVRIIEAKLFHDYSVMYTVLLIFEIIITFRCRKALSSNRHAKSRCENRSTKEAARHVLQIAH